MKYSLDRPKNKGHPTELLLEELRRAASHYGRRFSRHEFDEIALKCKGSAVLTRFHTWDEALQAAKISLPAVKKDRYFIEDQELFQEMQRIWDDVGHRPSYDEWVSRKPCYSYTTYKTRFGGWVKACEAFIAWITGESTAAVSETTLPPASVAIGDKDASRTIVLVKRHVPDKLRYKVLERDHFKCVLCGRSPATEAGVKLHIDHIVPFSKGGETQIDNLRSVCNTCNWGKGAELEFSY